MTGPFGCVCGFCAGQCARFTCPGCGSNWTDPRCFVLEKPGFDYQNGGRVCGPGFTCFGCWPLPDLAPPPCEDMAVRNDDMAMRDDDMVMPDDDMAMRDAGD